MNPEALHEKAKSQAPATDAKFVNPGTPDAALVSREQMTQATIKGTATDELKKNLIKG